MLEQLGVEAVEVRLPADLNDLSGLIIPGGESTTIGKLAVIYDLMEPLRAFAAEKAVWGTCAGMIFMAKDIGVDQPLLQVMDIVVERNAFGRQVDSFETALEIDGLTGDAPFPAIFIRGPRLVEAQADTEIISKLADGTAVAAKQGNWLVTSFHPELTGDDRMHRMFVEMAKAVG